ncbi:forkhead box protein I2-B-like [Phyllobates terribilis]|uniref:forkhead box protein I2-B-like n=1 Tax=Phyllobates terribilis TaxID=111132 RepID=UPI003CCB2546
MDVYSGNCFNLHQQKLHQPWRTSSVYGISDYPGQSVNPYWWFGGSAISPSYVNGSRYLASGYANSQAQVLGPLAGYRESEMIHMTPLNHDDIIKPVRPPYSISTLIIMALENAPEKKLTFHQICNYVVVNFPFYKRNEAGWRKALKSNLSVNNCFNKVAWDDRDPWKGNCWTLDPSYRKMLNNGHFKWQRRKYNSENKPSKELDHKSNMKYLKSDCSAESPESKIKSSPASYTSPCFLNFPSAIYEMRSNWASIQLMKDFSSYKQYAAELSTYRTDNIEKSSLPGQPIAQANLPQGLTLPNQLGESVLFSHQPSTCEPNAL